MKDMAEFKWSFVVVLLILAWIYIYIYIATWKMINPHIIKLKLLYDVELTKWIGDYQKAKIFFFFERINLKAEYKLSCFIACHLGDIEASHKLMEPH